MESLDTAYSFMDDFFTGIDEEFEEDGYQEKPNREKACREGRGPVGLALLDPEDPSRPLPELPEEELEWISNKDAFPALETFVDMLPGHQPGYQLPPIPAVKQRSPVSVLETSSHSTSSTVSGSSNGSATATTIMSCCGGLSVPVKARSKRRRTGCRDLRRLWTHQEESRLGRKAAGAAMSMGRKCQHCGAEKTPQWRAGPMGPKTLCNACGVRYKSGRLVPEYRPASSPSFSAEMHSNSHRKILEMRRQRQVRVPSTGNTVNKG